MLIKNINGISNSNCACGNWLKHWENFSHYQSISFCVVKNCCNRDLDGVHVQKADSPLDEWYIIPLCSVHKTSKGELEITDAYKLVSANKKETCEK